MIRQLNRWINPKYRIYVYIAIGSLAVVLISMTLHRCTNAQHSRDLAAQTKQGNKSAVAINAAASNAVDMVSEDATVKQQIDAATAIAKEDIGNAATSDEIRSAVVRALCADRVRDGERSDPACIVR